MVRSLFKFLRLPNLIIVGITQYVLLYCLLLPFLQHESISPTLDHFHFFLFVFDTILITMSGNIINDIEDVEIDLINRPETTFVQQYISIKNAYFLYAFVVVIGFILALYLAFYVDKLPLVLIYPFAVALLYFYSTHFKKLPAIGNIVVSIFCAGVAGIILFAEKDAYALMSPENSRNTFIAFGLYALFAFLTTLYREIIKDLEDKEGDAERGCKTLPIVLGEKNTKLIAFFIGISLVALMLYIALGFYVFSSSVILWLYHIIAIISPMIYLLYLNIKAKEKNDYHKISSAMKVIMLAGLIFLPLFYYYF